MTFLHLGVFQQKSVQMLMKLFHSANSLSSSKIAQKIIKKNNIIMLSISIINWFIIQDRRKENDILFQIAWFAEDTYESLSMHPCVLCTRKMYSQRSQNMKQFYKYFM